MPVPSPFLRAGVHMIRRWRGVICLLISMLSLPLLAHAQEERASRRGVVPAELRYSADDLAWMAQKKVVRFTLDPAWPPLEYAEAGEAKGLLVSYLDSLSHQMPLRFEYVPARDWAHALTLFEKGEVDLLPAASLQGDIRNEPAQGLGVVPYYSGAMLVAAPSDHPVVLEVANLAGQIVAVGRGEDIAFWLQKNLPAATLVPFDTPTEMLDAVWRGEADVAIGPELVLQPLLRRAYRGRMSTAGILAELPVVQRMWVQADQPALKTVLDKALLSLTAGQTDVVLENWLSNADFGRPSLEVLFAYYRTEAALIAILLLFLATTIMFTVRARRQAEQAERRKQRFLAVMSHEIRNAMNAVMGPLDILAFDAQSPRRAELIHTARDGARSLLLTVNQLLDLSKLEAKKLPLTPRPSGVAGLVDEVAALLRLGLNDSVALRVDVQVPPLLVLDSGKYRQVLMNLLSNAVKYTARGDIAVRICTAERAGTTWLQTEVIDTGVGIDTARIQDIFDDYSQAQNTKSVDGVVQGTGLGLAICKELVLLMGGTIHASSRLQEGTRIRFEVPVCLPSGPPEPTEVMASTVPLPSPSPSISTTKIPVLVVDDSPVNVMVLSHQLDLLAWPHESCESGKQALMHWASEPMRLVLLDCDMPGMSGYEVAGRMREIERTNRWPRTVILAVSAHSDDAHRRRCIQSGMDEVLLKPVEVDVLERVLTRWQTHINQTS